jgi:ABC-2 type transport system ATP-binding protein
MIRIENLSKNYGTLKAVDDISFTVHDGEILGFLGPNGAGKTTTLRIMTGFIPLTRGKVTVNDIDLEKNSIGIRERIGYLPESAPLYPEITVIDFLRFISRMRKISQRDEEERIRTTMKTCGIEEVAWQDIGELSKGYRQRVGLAQALIHDPEILILDEPTSGLDPNQIVEIRNLIKEIGKKKTVILSTHILPEVQATCNRIIIIHRGKLVADGPIDEITSGLSGRQQLKVQIKGDSNDIRGKLSDFPHASFQSEFAVDVEGVVGAIFESKDRGDSREELFDWVVGNGWKLLGLQSTEKSLEEVFMELTQ